MAAEELIRKFEEYEKSNAWIDLFKDIDRLTTKQEKELGLKTEVARAWINVEKNRYRNVLTYDNSRVTLRRVRAGASNYINASPLKVAEAARKYIMTQGPLASTCNDFWQMVWEQKSSLIVMLNRLFEKNSIKCHAYFPTEENPEAEFDTFFVSLKTEEHFTHFVVRTLEVQQKETSDSYESSSDQERNSSSSTDSSESDESEESARTVFHFQFTSWPDFGVPACAHVFLDFLYRVRSTGLLKDSPPTLVHCSAGIGRSGAFVVVDSVLSMVEHNVKSIDIIELILKLRRSRMGLIQTSQQLQFCWRSVATALRGGDKGNCNCDTQPSEWPKIVPSSENPPLMRSAANQMTSGGTAKSMNDLTDSSTLRKRSVGDSLEGTEDIKRSKRRVLVESMRNRLRESERKRSKYFFSLSNRFFGYAFVTATTAVGVYCVYRLYMTASFQTFINYVQDLGYNKSAVDSST